MRRTTAMWIFLAVALTILPALAAGQDSAQAKDPAPTSQAGPTYVIGPDDTLFISVWKEPDLTQTLPVRADGMISMPLLNDVRAAGRPGGLGTGDLKRVQVLRGVQFQCRGLLCGHCGSQP